MLIISYRPSDDQFWIACSKEEYEKWFVPLLNEERLQYYHDVLRMNLDRKRQDPENAAAYEKMVKPIILSISFGMAIALFVSAII